MRLHPSRRRAVVVSAAAAILSTALLAAPAVAAPTIVGAHEGHEHPACQVMDASFSWGFKESFRAYLSSAIAHGSWEPTGTATYETPLFTFSSTTGGVAADLSSGQVAFGGGIHFTGHEGLLDTTVENLTLHIEGGQGVVHADVSGVMMDDALAGVETVNNYEDIPFVTIDLSGAQISRDGDALSVDVTDAATAITPEGFDAFGNYEAGTAFDPISGSLTANCAVAEETPVATAAPAPAPTETAESATPAPVPTDEGVPGGLIAVVASSIAAAVGATVTAIVVTRRRRAAAADAAADQ